MDADWSAEFLQHVAFCSDPQSQYFSTAFQIYTAWQWFNHSHHGIKDLFLPDCVHFMSKYCITYRQDQGDNGSGEVGGGGWERTEWGEVGRRVGSSGGKWLQQKTLKPIIHRFHWYLRPTFRVIAILILHVTAILLPPCFKSCSQQAMNKKNVCFDWLTDDKNRSVSVLYLHQRCKMFDKTWQVEGNNSKVVTGRLNLSALENPLMINTAQALFLKELHRDIADRKPFTEWLQHGKWPQGP